MTFNYSVFLVDPNAEPAAVDSGLVADLKAALGEWAHYIAGAPGATLNVSLDITTLAVVGAAGGPAAMKNIGTTSTGATIAEPASTYVLDTGQQPANVTTDINIYADPRALGAWYISQNPGAVGNSVPAGEYDATSIFLHEVGHGLGFTGYYETQNNQGIMTSGGRYETPYDTYIQTKPNGTAYFTGPKAEAANEGPVQLTTIGPPGSNYYHLANAQNDVMTGTVLTTGVAYQISPVDLAILADTGVPVIGSASLAGTSSVGAAASVSGSVGGVAAAPSLGGADGASSVSSVAGNAGGGGVASIGSTGSVPAASIGGASVGGSGSASVGAEAPCFVAGTHILTPNGEVHVQGLRPGDLVRTLSGQTAVVKWVGHRAVKLGESTIRAAIAPVCIDEDAIAPGSPHRDVWLSPDHAVFVDGVLIPVHKLVNGVSIHRDMEMENVTYVHVELHQHDILLASGMPAESYMDTGNRGQFDRECGVRPLYPTPATDGLQAALDAYASRGCAPFCLDGERVESAHCRLLARANAVIGKSIPARLSEGKAA